MRSRSDNSHNIRWNKTLPQAYVLRETDRRARTGDAHERETQDRDPSRLL